MSATIKVYDPEGVFNATALDGLEFVEGKVILEDSGSGEALVAIWKPIMLVLSVVRWEPNYEVTQGGAWINMESEARFNHWLSMMELAL